MKCIVSNYAAGEVVILSIINNLQSEEIEKTLTEEHGFSLGDIEWIMVNDDSIRYEK